MIRPIGRRDSRSARRSPSGGVGRGDLGTLEVERPSDWRTWLRRNHLKEKGVWLVFRRKGSTARSIGYADALDGALAFGWIDSTIRRIDGERYARKFTPRRPGSVWSEPNVRRVEELKAGGRMTKWGLRLYENRPSDLVSKSAKQTGGVSN